MSGYQASPHMHEAITSKSTLEILITSKPSVLSAPVFCHLCVGILSRVDQLYPVPTSAKPGTPRQCIGYENEEWLVLPSWQRTGREPWIRSGCPHLLYNCTSRSLQPLNSQTCQRSKHFVEIDIIGQSTCPSTL